MKTITILITGIICCFFAVSVGWTDEQKDHICFRTLDGNGDGKVTLEEFTGYYESGEDTFNKADLNKDGSLSHDEYHDILGHGSLNKN